MKWLVVPALIYRRRSGEGNTATDSSYLSSEFKGIVRNLGQSWSTTISKWASVLFIIGDRFQWWFNGDVLLPSSDNGEHIFQKPTRVRCGSSSPQGAARRCDGVNRHHSIDPSSWWRSPPRTLTSHCVWPNAVVELYKKARGDGGF